MPQDVLEVTKRFMRDPVQILVKKEELTLEGIKQFYIHVEKEVGELCFIVDIFKVETFVKVITKCQSFCLYCRVGFCCKLGAKFLKIFGLAHSSLNCS